MDLTGAVDGLVVAILLIAAARGLMRGLIREVFSIAALAASVITVRVFTPPAAAWLEQASGGEIGAAAAPWVAGAVVAIATVTAVAIAGRFLRMGARAAGLGLADRLGGGAIGAAEGVLIVGLLMLGTAWLIGPDHPILTTSRSYQAFEELQALASERADTLPAVAAPPDAN